MSRPKQRQWGGQYRAAAPSETLAEQLEATWVRLDSEDRGLELHSAARAHWGALRGP